MALKHGVRSHDEQQRLARKRKWDPLEDDEDSFELRWEFDASADGEKADWQPMSKDMNNALEKRWTKGWHGDDALDIFYVHTGRVTYGIDCYSMVQWNQRTQRSRQIRRGEARPDVTVLLPKLAEKDAHVARLRAERNKLAEVNKNLVQDNYELRSERDGLVEDVARLRAERNERAEENKNLLEDNYDLQNRRDGLVEDRKSLVRERKDLLNTISKLELLRCKHVNVLGSTRVFKRFCIYMRIG